MPQVDFHKLPHKISAEHRILPPAHKMAAAVIAPRDDLGSKASPFLSKYGGDYTKPMSLTQGLLAQMYAINNMLPAGFTAPAAGKISQTYIFVCDGSVD